VNRARSVGLIVAAGLATGLLLAWLDGKGFRIGAVAAYALLVALSLAAIAWAHHSLSTEESRRLLLSLAIGAMGLRLAAGWALARGLPDLGYDENAQNQGYVFWDAYKRDTDAWQRARGDLPLTVSFTDPKSSDQYGGLLFVSGAVYRYLGGESHRPLLIIVLTAAASALGVLFIFGFAASRWGAAVGLASAWIATLLPESILLGASQMREPFLITGLAMAMYGYAVSRGQARSRGIFWIVGGLLVLLFFSPPTALAGAGVVALAALWESTGRPRLPAWVVWLGIPIVLAALFLVLRSWARLEQITGSFGEVFVQWLQNAGAAWRVGQATAGSDMLEAVLDDLPQGARLAFLVAYGLVQPFLPAAIAAPGNALWKTIAILRSLGWFALVPPLVYGAVAAIRSRGWRSLEAYLGVLVWGTALLASYRAPGYQWDNPRYRAVFLVAQAGLAAWAWMSARSVASPWLRRTYVGLGLVTLVILHWYVGRYADLPSLNLASTVAAAVVLPVIYLGVCLARDRRAVVRSRDGLADV
jgi:hypothetical protein